MLACGLGLTCEHTFGQAADAGAGYQRERVGTDARRGRVTTAPRERGDGRRGPQRPSRPGVQGPQRPGPQVAAGSFQRPYPYHLDYYKQKFGGSYAPYFGNLYGPPNVVLAPYGGYAGPGFGYGGYPPQGYGVDPRLNQPPVANGAPVTTIQPPSASGAHLIECPHCRATFQLQQQTGSFAEPQQP